MSLFQPSFIVKSTDLNNEGSLRGETIVARAMEALLYESTELEKSAWRKSFSS